jgi:lactobin A/cerein 7B family class IIb bacteriocin
MDNNLNSIVENIEVVELTSKELENTEGGIVPVVLGVLAFLNVGIGVTALSYGVGYYYGAQEAKAKK